MKETAKHEAWFTKALHSCPKLCSHLGLQGLACLAAASSSLKHACLVSCRRDAVALLEPAFDALATAHGEQQQQKQQLTAVVWLLRAVPAAATAGVSGRLATTPLVPLGLAKQLVAAGVRISYAQVLAAAHSMVAGVEVWVQAQQQLGVHSDIPATAEWVCCRQDWVSCKQKKCSAISFPKAYTRAV
jgi:hypothetical protein